MKRLFLSVLAVLVVGGLLASAPAAHAQNAAGLTATVDRSRQAGRTLGVGWWRYRQQPHHNQNCQDRKE